jgi:PAS domain S-box-containing protein
MPFSDHGGIFATGHDFTNRRMAEDALRESEERFRQIAESIREVIWLTDLGSDEILYVSPAYELTWGRTRESLYRAPKSWLAAVHPEDLPLATGGLASAAAGIPSEAAYRLVRPDGSTRAVQDHRFPIRDVSGKVFRIAGVVEDVTDRRNLEEQLRQAQKMEAIGVLAGGVAHDFNNLLTVINGYAEFLIERLREQEQEREFAKHILHAGEHAASLTQQLLAFSRKQILLPEVIDLNQILTDTKKLLDRIIGEDIRLEIVMDPDLWSTKVDKGQFEQVLMNLVVNARDAMPQGGDLHIKTANVWIDEASVSLDVGIAVGEYVRLTVADSGIGMDAATKARIFEPFFTTKGPQKGTGLGLSTVFGIISQSRGYIDIHSEPGVGTTFSVYLPRELPSVNPERVQRPSRAPHGKETILVAEDDETVRTFTKQVLTHYGYRVLIANDGLQAVVVAESYPGEIHLLLTDVVMPNLGGQKLVEKVRSFRPEMKVLYMSGYTDETVLQHLDRSAQTMFIHKPFSPDTLACKVREVLESSSI